MDAVSTEGTPDMWSHLEVDYDHALMVFTLGNLEAFSSSSSTYYDDWSWRDSSTAGRLVANAGCSNIMDGPGAATCKKCHKQRR